MPLTIYDNHAAPMYDAAGHMLSALTATRGQNIENDLAQRRLAEQKREFDLQQLFHFAAQARQSAAAERGQDKHLEGQYLNEIGNIQSDWQREVNRARAAGLDFSPSQQSRINLLDSKFREAVLNGNLSETQKLQAAIVHQKQLATIVPEQVTKNAEQLANESIIVRNGIEYQVVKDAHGNAVLHELGVKQTANERADQAKLKYEQSLKIAADKSFNDKLAAGLTPEQAGAAVQGVFGFNPAIGLNAAPGQRFGKGVLAEQKQQDDRRKWLLDKKAAIERSVRQQHKEAATLKGLTSVDEAAIAKDTEAALEPYRQQDALWHGGTPQVIVPRPQAAPTAAPAEMGVRPLPDERFLQGIGENKGAALRANAAVQRKIEQIPAGDYLKESVFTPEFVQHVLSEPELPREMFNKAGNGSAYNNYRIARRSVLETVPLVRSAKDLETIAPGAIVRDAEGKLFKKPERLLAPALPVPPEPTVGAPSQVPVPPNPEALLPNDVPKELSGVQQDYPEVSGAPLAAEALSIPDQRLDLYLSHDEMQPHLDSETPLNRRELGTLLGVQDGSDLQDRYAVYLLARSLKRKQLERSAGERSTSGFSEVPPNEETDLPEG